MGYPLFWPSNAFIQFKFIQLQYIDGATSFYEVHCSKTCSKLFPLHELTALLDDTIVSSFTRREEKKKHVSSSFTRRDRETGSFVVPGKKMMILSLAFPENFASFFLIPVAKE